MVSTTILFGRLVGLALLAAPTITEDLPSLKLFPAAKNGMERYVIELPQKDRQEAEGLRVEIMVGKEMPTDGVNSVGFAGEIESRVVDGWGITYYKLPAPPMIYLTAVGVPEGRPKVIKFVSTPGLHLPYSHRPIVVYVPAGYEARYRIWKASEPTTAVMK